MQVIDLIQGRKWKCAQCAKYAGSEGFDVCRLVNYRIPGAMLEIGFIHHGTEIRITFPDIRLGSSALAYEYAAWLEQIEPFSNKPWVPFRSGAIEKSPKGLVKTVAESAQATWGKKMIDALGDLAISQKPKAQPDQNGFRDFVDKKIGKPWTPENLDFDFTRNPPDVLAPDQEGLEAIQRRIVERIRSQMMGRSMNPDVGISFNRSRFEGIRKPRCMVCNREVERIQIFEDYDRDQFRMEFYCHGRGDQVSFSRREFISRDPRYMSELVSTLPAFKADYERLNGQPAAAPAPTPKRPQINLANPPPRRIILE